MNDYKDEPGKNQETNKEVREAIPVRANRILKNKVLKKRTLMF
jgi:hypothetical protein